MTQPNMRVVNQRLQTLFLQRAVNKRQAGRNRVIEDDTSDSSVDDTPHVFLRRRAEDVLRVVFLGQIDQVTLDAQFDRSLRRNFLRIQSK